MYPPPPSFILPHLPSTWSFSFNRKREIELKSAFDISSLLQINKMIRLCQQDDFHSFHPPTSISLPPPPIPPLSSDWNLETHLLPCSQTQLQPCQVVCTRPLHCFSPRSLPSLLLLSLFFFIPPPSAAGSVENLPKLPVILAATCK